eukprot:TRINITY_DN8970_c0_g1_i1.p1 TRINITY_DN8970_c0_g1~~TRINITY_DN8970_c0_g1_i1.p1  ORF type:complete len:420 (+),score=63.07 TRINITY_DN8970_c0_g1_i1:43-1302(+)
MGAWNSLRICFLTLFLKCGVVHSWDTEGHERIHRVAQGLLAGKHADQIRTMMHSDLIDMANWESVMTEKYPDTWKLHSHRQQVPWTCGDKGGFAAKCDPGQTDSIFCALSYIWDHFSHDALLTDYPEPSEKIFVPQEISVLRNIPNSEKTPAQLLRWLVILVGDIHEPMHFMQEYSYGADIMIKYRDQESNMFDFFESVITKKIPKKYNKASFHPNSEDKDYNDNSAKWEHKVPTELFSDWSKDVAEQLCTEIIQPMTVNHADGSKIDSPYELTEEMYQKWLKLVEKLTLLAGERVAFILDDILEHKRHKDALADGRGLPSRKIAVGSQHLSREEFEKEKKSIYKAPKKGKGKGKGVVGKRKANRFKLLKRQAQARNARREAFYNLLVAVVVVPSLLYGLRWHEKKGGFVVTKGLGRRL